MPLPVPLLFPVPFIKFQCWFPCPDDFENSVPFLCPPFFPPFFSFLLCFLFLSLSTKLPLRHQCPSVPGLRSEKLQSPEFAQQGSSKDSIGDTLGSPHGPEHKFAKFGRSISDVVAKLLWFCPTTLPRRHHRAKVGPTVARTEI